jgi:hypothetical protein
MHTYAHRISRVYECHVFATSAGDAPRNPKVKAAEAAHAALQHPLGDCFTYLNVYNQWQRAGAGDNWAKQNFLRVR